MEEFCVTITEEYEEERIDKFISTIFSEFSRSYIQKLIKESHVFVNGVLAKANYKLKMGDAVLFRIPEMKPLDIEPENLPISVLYEDDDIIIVNKPKGMVVHPASGHYSGTLVNALLYHCQENLSGINGVMRPGIVHRIDKDTTGSLVICKNDMAHNFIAEQLKEHSIKRQYRAIVHGLVKQEEGTVNAPIGRHPNERKKMAINAKSGKEAITHYKVLERFSQYTYIECQLETGRTHQIRVHMASIGHPIAGDVVYSNRKETEKQKLQGQTLHAMTIGLMKPSDGTYLEINAPLPEYFEAFLASLREN